MIILINKLILPIGQIFYRMTGKDFEQAPLRLSPEIF